MIMSSVTVSSANPVQSQERKNGPRCQIHDSNKTEMASLLYPLQIIS
jgi:hypothetical protein